MIKLCIDNTSKLNEFHLYEPYLYGVIKNKNCYLVNDFSKDNSDIEKLGTAIYDAHNILIDNVRSSYEVTVVTELLENDKSLIQKLHEIDKYVTNSFSNSRIQKTQNITVIVLDYTGNSHVNFAKNYVVDGNSNLYFTKTELLACDKLLKTEKNRQAFVEELNTIRATKEVNNQNEWYYEIFDKMIEHFYDNDLFPMNDNEEVNIIDTFAKIISYYVQKDMLDNKLILRCDMYSHFDFSVSDERNFAEMNKIISLLLFDMGDLLVKSKKTLLKGIYDVQVGLDNEKIKAMIMQYSENLKMQRQYLLSSKKDRIEVAKRTKPNISLKNIFLEPVKLKNEKLTFFKSSRNNQYLDRMEKNATTAINKRIAKVKKNNVQNVCDLRTLRYIDNRNLEKEKLTLIELNAKIEDKVLEYEKKSNLVAKNKVNYYSVLEEFMNKQKVEKEEISLLMNRKIEFKPFLLFSVIFYIIAIFFAMVSCPEIVDKLENKKLVFITIGALVLINVITAIGVMIADNIKINKRIDEYVKMVNEYNSKLQISSDDEIKKLTHTYELILLNSDIEYYKERYEELLNDIGKYEFHIAQVEKHINIAKRLCDRIGVNFDEIIIANDLKYDEKNIDVDVDKDVYSNECYDIMHFLFDTKDYCLMLNGGEVMEQTTIKTYIKSINFTEDEVYRV